MLGSLFLMAMNEFLSQNISFGGSVSFFVSSLQVLLKKNIAHAFLKLLRRLSSSPSSEEAHRFERDE